VLESGQRQRLPDWMVWNQDKLLLEGVAGDADVGNDCVIMVCLVRKSFGIYCGCVWIVGVESED